ncbi:MAG: TPM domain-containing protein [Prolixibacteraceae bacterium]
MKMIKKILILLAVLLVAPAFGQDIPERPDPPRLVNDFAGVLDAGQAAQLEEQLSAYARQTTTQIVILTVPALDGYDISDYAFQVGEKWGIGQKGKDNGVIIVFKPKTAEENGRVFVAVGYGLESVIPDAVANRLIVESEMVPRFKEGDIYGGLANASKVIMGLASKEFTPQQYQEKVAGSGGGGGLPFVVILIIIFFIISIFRGRRRYYTGGSNLPFWLLLGSMMGSGHRSGSWGGFSGGGGSSFGGGGGFGGFGGGSFGGGGAGGSW